jgi:hypothetical protein
MLSAEQPKSQKKSQKRFFFFAAETLRKYIVTARRAPRFLAIRPHSP